MRLPGTLKSLLAQIKASPVPIGSISITAEGAVALTFVEGPAPAPKAEPAKPPAPNAKPLRQRDTIGAFSTPPIGREDPFTPLADS